MDNNPCYVSAAQAPAVWGEQGAGAKLTETWTIYCTALPKIRIETTASISHLLW